MRSPPEFQLVFEQGPGCCLLLAPEAPFTLLAVTDAFLRSMGRGRESLVGRSLLEVFPERFTLQAALEQVRATQVPVTVDAGVLTPLRSPGGQVHCVHLQWTERPDGRPVPPGQAALSEALERSEARYRVLFESIDDGYCLMRLLFDETWRPVDYRFLETNAAFEEQTGLRNAVDRTARELVPTLDESWFQLYGRVALTGEPTRFENHAPAMGRWFEVFANRVGPPEERLVALVFKNITARKRAEEQREQALASEQVARAEAEAERRKLHDLFMQAPAPICILEGPEHTFTFANPRYRALVGNRDVVGKPLLEVLPDVKGQGFDGLLEQVVASGKPFFGNEVPVRLAHLPSNELLFLNFVYAPKRNAAGEVDGVLVAAADVTAQVLARGRVEALVQQLRESEERLRRVVDITGAGAWETELSTREILADERFRDMFGLRPGDSFTLARCFALMHAEDRPRVQRLVQGALAGEQGGRYVTEYRTVGPHDGRVRWVETRGEVVFSAEGAALRMLGTGVDITWRKEAEVAQQRLLEALGDQPLLYVALLRGRELRFEMANALYRRMVGGREVVGRTLHEALPELENQGFDEQLTRVLETGESFVGHQVHARVDRRGQGLEDTYFNHVYHAVLGTNGAPEAVLVLGQDMTDEVLRRREAERQQQERSAFEQQLIGIVSHDLRNPLNAILLSTTVLAQRAELSERTLKGVLRIQSSAERMGRMVRDLLDFTQARLGGGIPLKPAPMDLHALVHQTVEEVRVSHPSRELRVETRGEGEGAWDADRLAQVVQNLVSNALKYSPEGTPVTVCSQGGEDGRVAISIHNTGVPIPPEAQGRIFQPMERLSSQVDRLGRSVGLGLYIVKHIVDAHGGTVDVTSTAEEGTTFTVRLPRRGA